MIVAAAVVHGDAVRFLRHSSAESPLALQLGGSDPRLLAAAARAGADAGFDEINLNVGCPSSRVRAGAFGACLMAQPELVAECVAAMKSVVNRPVTVKTRIGIDHRDSYEQLAKLVRLSAAAGAEVFAIHARKAWLSGLNPRQNRQLPPLNYETIYRLKRDFADLTIIINGGISDLGVAARHLEFVDGVMLGRAAYHDSALLADVDTALFDAHGKRAHRPHALRRYLAYADEQLAQGTPIGHLCKPLIGLYKGIPGAKSWRRALNEISRSGATHAGALRHAAESIEDRLMAVAA
jgi:tRNA-dihydrouridine synthase A